MPGESANDQRFVLATGEHTIGGAEGTHVVREEDLVRRQKPRSLQEELAEGDEHLLSICAGYRRHGDEQIEEGTTDDQAVGVHFVLDVLRELLLVALTADTVRVHAVLADDCRIVDDILHRERVPQDSSVASCPFNQTNVSAAENFETSRALLLVGSNSKVPCALALTGTVERSAVGVE